MTYRTVADELYDEAVKAKAWHDTTGMKVARPPAMPEAVSRWIVGFCRPFSEGTAYAETVEHTFEVLRKWAATSQYRAVEEQVLHLGSSGVATLIEIQNALDARK